MFSQCFHIPQPGTSLHCDTIDTGLPHCTFHSIVHYRIASFASQLSLVLILPSSRGMARLSHPGWMIECDDTLTHSEEKAPVSV